MTERIPDEVLRAAHLRWCRRVAATIINGMAERGISYEEMEAKIGQKPGFVKRWLNKYIEGTTREGREMTDLCCALGCEPIIKLHLLDMPEPSAAVSEGATQP